MKGTPPTLSVNPEPELTVKAYAIAANGNMWSVYPTYSST
jgi:hypothetical protein